MSNLQLQQETLSQDLWAIKIKACDLSQWSPDLEKDVATATKSPVEVESWGKCPKIDLETQSWIHFWGNNPITVSSFLCEIEAKGHFAFIANTPSCNTLVYDAKRREIVAWRSENGPSLYWSIQKHTLILSSGLCGPVRAGWLALSPNRETIASYLYLGQVPQNSSLVEELYKLAPGQGIVFKLQSGALFDFESHLHEKTDSQIQDISFLSPLEALWQLQEPRADFFLRRHSSFPLFKDFEKALNETPPARASSSGMIFLLTRLMVRLKNTTNWGKNLRLWLSKLVYRSVEPLVQWFQKRAIFSYQEIANRMLLGSNQNFYPWNFLQTLTEQRLYEPMEDWPAEMSLHFHRMLPGQKISPAKENFSTDHVMEESEWAGWIQKLHKSSLVEEGMVPISLLYDLEYALKEPTDKAKLQASCLLSLELWLKIFIDWHANPPPDLKNWKQLIG